MATSIIGSIQIPKGTKVTIDVDTELSPDSQNPIANSAVYEAVQELQDQIEDINSPYNVNITNLLSADNSEAISEAIGGIDNLNATITKNQNIIGAVNNGEVSVSIRKLGNVTSLYYILDTLAGYTVNEINITNTDGTLSKTVVSHSMMTEEMVIDNLTTSESTLPLSANQGKILNDTKQATLVSGTNIKTVNGNSLLGEGNIDVSATIPIASDTVLGGIKVGAGLAIDEGVVSVDAGSVEAGSVQWENVKGKPSAFATNLANISDLQANWDAILKAAPTAFVEAIPTGEIEALFE